MNPVFKPCEHKLLTVWCNQWELGALEAVAECREEKETLIRSRLGVLEDYNGTCIIWKREVQASPWRSVWGQAVGKAGAFICQSSRDRSQKENTGNVLSVCEWPSFFPLCISTYLLYDCYAMRTVHQNFPLLTKKSFLHVALGLGFRYWGQNSTSSFLLRGNINILCYTIMFFI